MLNATLHTNQNWNAQPCQNKYEIPFDFFYKWASNLNRFSVLLRIDLSELEVLQKK